MDLSAEKMLKQKLAQFDLPHITFTQFSLVSVLCIVFAGLSHSTAHPAPMEACNEGNSLHS